MTCANSVRMIVLALLMVVAEISVARTASVELSSTGGFLNFRGQIVPGDLERLMSVVQSSGLSHLSAINLDSFGGDIAEAEKLERYFFSLRPDMIASVWKDSVCA